MLILGIVASLFGGSETEVLQHKRNGEINEFEETLGELPSLLKFTLLTTSTQTRSSRSSISAFSSHYHMISLNVTTLS